MKNSDRYFLKVAIASIFYIWGTGNREQVTGNR